MKNKLFIYLARLDRKGIEVIACIPFAKEIYPTRVTDPNRLSSDPDLKSLILSKINKNKMTHEIYAETAHSLNDLKTSLSARGYSNLPTHQFTGHSKPNNIDIKQLKTKNSVMIQRIKK